MYEGSTLRWRLRPLRRAVHVPLSWYRHVALPDGCAFIASYPRSGSTWLTMMLADVVSSGGSDFATIDGLVPAVGRLGAPFRRGRPPSGLIRTHEPWRKAYTKAIYVVRDPRDVAVSYYHYRRGLGEYDGTLARFVSMFVGGEVDSYGEWPAHVSSWLAAPDEARLIVRYEDLVGRTAAELARVCGFLGWDVREEAVAAAVEVNSLDGMRRKEDGSLVMKGRARGDRFVRSGRTGGWRGVLEPADANLIRAHCRGPMDALGYPSESAVESGSGTTAAPAG